MIIKGKDPIAGSNEGITSTKITGTTTRQGLDVVQYDGNGEVIGGVLSLPPSIIINPTVTVDTAAYTAQDNIGGKLTLSNAMRVDGGTGILQSILVTDNSDQKPALEIVIFNSDPTASTITDNTPISIASGDMGKVIRRVTVTQSDYVNVGGKYIADINPGSRLLQSVSGSKDLYAALVATGTPDFVNTTDLNIKFGIMRD